MREIIQTIPYCLQNPVPHSLADQIPPQDTHARHRVVLAHQAGGSAQILSRLALYRDRDRQRPYTPAHDHSSQIQREQGGSNDQSEYQPRLAREICALPQQSLLGQWRNLVKRVLRLNGWYRREYYQALCAATGRGRRWTSAA